MTDVFSSSGSNLPMGVQMRPCFSFSSRHNSKSPKFFKLYGTSLSLVRFDENAERTSSLSSFTVLFGGASRNRVSLWVLTRIGYVLYVPRGGYASEQHGQKDIQVITPGIYQLPCWLSKSRLSRVSNARARRKWDSFSDD